GGDLRDARRSGARHLADGRLEAAEAEVVALAEPGPGQPGRLRRRFAGLPLDQGTTGKAETEDARRLIEGFAGGVIPGTADQAVAAVRLGEDDLAMAAGDDEDHGRERR